MGNFLVLARLENTESKMKAKQGIVLLALFNLSLPDIIVRCFVKPRDSLRLSACLFKEAAWRIKGLWLLFVLWKYEVKFATIWEGWKFD